MRDGWEIRKLGDIASYTSGSRPPGGVGGIKEGVLSLGGEHIGKNGWLDLTSPKYVEHDYYIANSKGHINDNDILLCKDGALTGKVAIVRDELVDKKAMVNEHVFIIRSNVVGQQCLYYFLFSPTGQTALKARITGAAQGGINGTNLKTILVPVPPISEQEKIVAELDCLTCIIAKKKQQLEELDKLAQSIFYDMFGNEDEVLSRWATAQLQDICSNIVDCPHTTPKKETRPTPFPCIRTSELKGGNISWASMQYVSKQEYETRITRLSPKAGDIVYGREGSFGDAVILPTGYSFCLGQRTMLFRANQDYVNNVFLHRVLISPIIYKQAKDNSVSSTVSHINVKDIKCFLVPIPPIDLQNEFAQKVEAIEKLRELVKRSIVETEALFNSRMDYWFN